MLPYVGWSLLLLVSATDISLALASPPAVKLLLKWNEKWSVLANNIGVFALFCNSNSDELVVVRLFGRHCLVFLGTVHGRNELQ